MGGMGSGGVGVVRMRAGTQSSILQIAGGRQKARAQLRCQATAKHPLSTAISSAGELSTRLIKTKPNLYSSKHRQLSATGKAELCDSDRTVHFQNRKVARKPVDCRACFCR